MFDPEFPSGWDDTKDDCTCSIEETCPLCVEDKAAAMVDDWDEEDHL